MADVPHLSAQAMALSDHPREPVVMHLGVKFAQPVATTVLKQATRELLRRHPRLRAAMRVNEHKCSFITAKLDDHLVERVWQHDHLPLAEFREQAIDFTQAPLLRFRYRHEDGLWLLIHHALADGRAALMLLMALQAVLSGAPFSAEPGDDEEQKGARRRIALGKRATAFARGVLFHRARRAPPVLLGPVRIAGTAHHFEPRVLSLDTLKALRLALKQRFNGATLNDVLIAAVQLTCAESLDEQRAAGSFFGGEHKISVMVPIDLRPTEVVSEPFHNYASTVSISSMPEHRSNPRVLVAHVAAQMQRARWHHLGYAFVVALQIYEWLGAMKQSRRIRLQQGLPRRAVGSGKYWRKLDTVLLSNLGRLRLPRDGSVISIEGYAPVIPPMGVAIDVATSAQGLHLWLHSSNATLDATQSVAFMERLVTHIERLAGSTTG